jgi:hypothetical protein
MYHQLRSMPVIYDKTKLQLTILGHMRSGFSGSHVVRVAQLQVITFYAWCCDVCCNFRVNLMSIRIYFICFVGD